MLHYDIIIQIRVYTAQYKHLSFYRLIYGVQRICLATGVKLLVSMTRFSGQSWQPSSHTHTHTHAHIQCSYTFSAGIHFSCFRNCPASSVGGPREFQTMNKTQLNRANDHILQCTHTHTHTHTQCCIYASSFHRCQYSTGTWSSGAADPGSTGSGHCSQAHLALSQALCPTPPHNVYRMSHLDSECSVHTCPICKFKECL